MRSLVGMFLPLTVLRSRYGDKQWFDACNFLQWQFSTMVDTYGGVDPLDVIPLFLKMVAMLFLQNEAFFYFLWAHPSWIPSVVLAVR